MKRIARKLVRRLSLRRYEALPGRQEMRIYELSCLLRLRDSALPAKGRIEAGYDADLTLVDLGSSQTLRPGDLHRTHAVSPYISRTEKSQRAAMAASATGENGIMERLGHTRSSYRITHLLQTPDAFVRAPLPGMKRATAIVHIAPAAGGGFTQYTAEFESGGHLGETSAQRFIYVRDGELTITCGLELHRLLPGHFAYIPQQYPAAVDASSESRAVIIEKPYEHLSPLPSPSLLTGDEALVKPAYLNDDDWLEVRRLLPDDPSFDFAVNIMTFQPGASLPMVEMHVMEHGLLMLEGGGIYRLGDEWYSACAGDFIWMAPYCPQWFGAIGKAPARYLIYKDWNRHPLTE